MGVFEFDRRGMEMMLERRGGKVYALWELISNVLDLKLATFCKVTLERDAEKQRRYWLTVEDDNPEGFKNLSDAYTIFAPSEKVADAESRGRFNLGEKLVLAICDEATVRSTKGTIYFDMLKNDRRETREKTKTGSVFHGLVKMTKDEFEECCTKVKLLIPNSMIDVTFNGQKIERRRPLATLDAEKLETEIAEREGEPLRRTKRNTKIEVYKAEVGETPMLYELGIPVVETEDRWHYNVLQRVPLNIERDNVTPAFLRHVRTIVLNGMAECIEPEDTSATWVKEALPKAAPEAVKAVVVAQFGENAVGPAAPGDKEAEGIAKAQGLEVVPANTYSKETWKTIRENNLLPSASVATPSPKVQIQLVSDPAQSDEIPEDQWTPGMQRIAVYAMDLAREIMDVNLTVTMMKPKRKLDHLAAYGKGGKLYFNVRELGEKWFNREVIDVKVNELLIHEFAHETASNHLSVEYHRALSNLGAKLTKLAVECPQFWRETVKPQEKKS